MVRRLFIILQTLLRMQPLYHPATAHGPDQPSNAAIVERASPRTD